MLQAYDKDGNKIDYAFCDTDYVVEEDECTTHFLEHGKCKDCGMTAQEILSKPQSATIHIKPEESLFDDDRTVAWGE